MIENCLDGKSGAELDMFAVGDTVVCALSVESAHVGGCACADGIGEELGAAGGGTRRGVAHLPGVGLSLGDGDGETLEACRGAAGAW